VLAYYYNFDYEMVMIERASFNLKVITPIRHHELYSVKFDIRGDNGGGSSQLELTVDVQLYKLSCKIDADSLSGKFRVGFIGNDGEMKANFLLEAADLWPQLPTIFSHFVFFFWSTCFE
jgi:hypothetical protein